MPFYSIYTGHIKNEIFTSWDECKKEIHKKPKYKKFATFQEAEQFHKHGPFTTEGDFDLCVYTDGSCQNNGKNNSTGGYGIYFGENDPSNVSCRIQGATNNIAELMAIIEAIKILKGDDRTIGIYTDSQYSILCCTTYGEKCKKKNWKDVPNAELVQEGYTLMQAHPNIKLIHVTAHTLKQDIHSIGNREADKLARGI